MVVIMCIQSVPVQKSQASTSFISPLAIRLPHLVASFHRSQIRCVIIPTVCFANAKNLMIKTLYYELNIISHTSNLSFSRMCSTATIDSIFNPLMLNDPNFKVEFGSDGSLSGFKHRFCNWALRLLVNFCLCVAGEYVILSSVLFVWRFFILFKALLWFFLPMV